jgi:hypothetical protein
MDRIFNTGQGIQMVEVATSPVVTRQYGELKAGALLLCLALAYPGALSGFFHSEINLQKAIDWPTVVALWLGVALCLCVIYGVVIAGFVVALKADKLASSSKSATRLRLLAYTVFATPPLFTLFGLYGDVIIGIPNLAALAWLVFWASVAGMFLVRRGASGRQVPWSSRPTVIRVVHGTSALAILVIFLLAHIFNHVAGFWSPTAHISVMTVFRNLYRNDVVQPILLALFAVQLVSGYLVLRRYSTKRRDWIGCLLASSGAYLAVFIPSHASAVFIVGRATMKADTNWWWLTGAPFGMLADAWSVRLIPHYSLAMFLVVAHLSGGLRTVLVAHGVCERTANRLAVVLVLLGAIGALMTISGLLGVHLT